ncbi:MAG: hypothetical protein AB7P01_04955 [Bacteroidia bacterium]
MKAKTVTLLILIVGLLTSCNPNSGNTPSSFEQGLVGTWYIKRKTVTDPLNTSAECVKVETSTDTAHCKVKFSSNPYGGHFYCENGLYSCDPTVMPWSAVSPYITLAGWQYHILNQTNNSLTLKNYDDGQFEKIYQLEKNYSDLYTTCSFTYSVEFNNPIPLGAGGSRLYISYTDDNGITQPVDMTGLTTWSQTVSQNFAQSLHTYSYIVDFPFAINVDNGGSNWATLATVKITDGDGTVIGQVGPKEFCLDDNGAPINCSDDAEPEDDFRIELNCTN